MPKPEWYETTRQRQLSMNPQTWAALQEHGVSESTQVQLEFFYNAPSEDSANVLARFLKDETDYDVDAHSLKMGGLLSKKTWSVTGSTRPTSLTLDVLDEWVEWMIAAGAEHGECEFDGWGAQAP